MAALVAVGVLIVAGGVMTSSTVVYADSEQGKGWPKTTWYLPESQEK